MDLRQKVENKAVEAADEFKKLNPFAIDAVRISYEKIHRRLSIMVRM